MASIVVQALSASEAARNRGHERFERIERVVIRRSLAENLRIDAKQEFGILIGGAAEHDPVDMGEMSARLREVRHAAVENDRPVADARI